MIRMSCTVEIPTGFETYRIFLPVAFDSQEKQSNCNMRFEWMEIFLQNIVQCNPIGKRS
jgi:hypothetical protein